MAILVLDWVNERDEAVAAYVLRFLFHILLVFDHGVGIFCQVETGLDEGVGGVYTHGVHQRPRCYSIQEGWIGKSKKVFLFVLLASLRHWFRVADSADTMVRWYLIIGTQMNNIPTSVSG